MTSVTSTTDPVRAVIELLETYDAPGDWVNFGEVPIIERLEDTTQQEKRARKHPALYVFSPADAAIEQFESENDRFEVDEFVRVECWVWNDSDGAGNLAGDVFDHLAAYANDRRQRTNWVSVIPLSVSDNTAQKDPSPRGGHVQVFVQFRLKRLTAY